ncbi:MAG: DNA topoisomerase I [Amphritea sp.]
MLQDNLILLISIAAIGCIAVFINFYISSKEQREEARIKRLTVLKKKAVDALNTLAVLREANCKPAIIEAVNKHAMGMFEEIANLAPGSELLESIGAQKESSEQATAIPGGFTSDRELKRAQIYIHHGEKILIEMSKSGTLPLNQATQYQHDLYWLHVCLFADAHIQQGNYYLERAEKLNAMSHYKHAKAIITRTSVQQKKKQEYLDQIRVLMNKARPSNPLSVTLAASLEELEQEEAKKANQST